MPICQIFFEDSYRNLKVIVITMQLRNLKFQDLPCHLSLLIVREREWEIVRESEREGKKGEERERGRDRERRRQN